MAMTGARDAHRGSIKRPTCHDARRRTRMKAEGYLCESGGWAEDETDVHLVRCSSLVTSPLSVAEHVPPSVAMRPRRLSVAEKLTNLISRDRADLFKTDIFGSSVAAWAAR
jgi:hypothetical protein